MCDNNITSSELISAIDFLKPLGVQFNSINEETLSIIKHLTDDMYIQNNDNINTSDNSNIEYPWNYRYGCKLYLEKSLGHRTFLIKGKGLTPEEITSEKNNIFALHCNGYCKNENIICPFYYSDYEAEKDNIYTNPYHYYGFRPCKMSSKAIINVRSYFEQFKSSLILLINAKKVENNAEKG